MSQHDMNIANQGFPSFRADLNNALAALVSNSSGATEPTTMFAHQFWVDTAANPSVLKIRNADNDAWITIGTINQTGDTFTLTSAVSATTLNTSGAVVFNDAGADVDFRVEGDTDANLLFVDASTDRVGIGTNAPTDTLDVAGGITISAANGLDVTGSDSTTSQTPLTFYRGGFGDTTGGAVRIRTVGDGSNNAVTMIFDTNSTECMRITSDGYLRMASGTGGIQFNGDTAAANALDDYEEGTWTPEVADATTGGNVGSATVNYATYVKIGKLVTIQATLTNIDTSGMTSANIFYVRGMPFTSASDNNAFGACQIDSVTFQGGRTTIIAQCGPSDSWVNFLQIGSNAVDTNTDCGDLTSGSADISFSITYEV